MTNNPIILWTSTKNLPSSPNNDIVLYWGSGIFYSNPSTSVKYTSNGKTKWEQHICSGSDFLLKKKIKPTAVSSYFY